MKKLIYFYTKHKQIIMYLLFGVITTVASFGACYLTMKIGMLVAPGENGEPTAMHDTLGSVVQWIVGVIVAFVTNKKWVFVEADKGIRVTLRQFTVFTGSRVLTLFLETGMNLGMIFLFQFLGYKTFSVLGFDVTERIWAKLITAVVVVITNYVVSKLFVFKKRDKKKKPKKVKEKGTDGEKSPQNESLDEKKL